MAVAVFVWMCMAVMVRMAVFLTVMHVGMLMGMFMVMVVLMAVLLFVELDFQCIPPFQKKYFSVKLYHKIA